MDPFPHILSSYIPYGKGLIGREGGNYSPIEKLNERSGFLDGQWMFIDNYLNKLGSQPIPHSVDRVSCCSILLKEMLPFATYGPNPWPNFTANSLGWSSNPLLISTKICGPKSGTEGFLASTFSNLSSESSIL